MSKRQFPQVLFIVIVLAISLAGGFLYKRHSKQLRSLKKIPPKGQASKKVLARPVKKRKAKKKRTPGQLLTIPQLKGAKAVWIPPGTFAMGSSEPEPGLGDKVPPQAKVTISQGFWMWQTEVTQQQFKALMGYNPAHFKKCGGNCPVEQVSWHQAAAWSNALSKKQGLETCFICKGKKDKLRCSARRSGKGYLRCKGWRLPSDAEWEHAARAGTKTHLYNGPVTADRYEKDPNAEKIAWYTMNSKDKTHPVAQKQANKWGLFDTAGNVSEWCFDAEVDGIDAVTTDPVYNTKNALKRSSRGGFWGNNAWFVRSARQGCIEAKYKADTIGFRVVRWSP